MDGEKYVDSQFSTSHLQRWQGIHLMDSPLHHSLSLFAPYGSLRYPTMLTKWTHLTDWYCRRQVRLLLALSFSFICSHLYPGTCSWCFSSFQKLKRILSIAFQKMSIQLVFSLVFLFCYYFIPMSVSGWWILVDEYYMFDLFPWFVSCWSRPCEWNADEEHPSRDTDNAIHLISLLAVVTMTAAPARITKKKQSTPLAATYVYWLSRMSYVFFSFPLAFFFFIAFYLFLWWGPSK